MSYKIAVSSTDGNFVNQSFGETKEFSIYEVKGLHYELVEKRTYEVIQDAKDPKRIDAEGCNPAKQCNSDKTGHCGEGNGCGSGGDHIRKVTMIADCRCIVCKKIGFQAQKQLEKLAISSFDVECTVEEALTKIVEYLHKIDTHQSLRS